MTSLAFKKKTGEREGGNRGGWEGQEVGLMGNKVRNIRCLEMSLRVDRSLDSQVGSVKANEDVSNMQNAHRQKQKYQREPRRLVSCAL